MGCAVPVALDGPDVPDGAPTVPTAVAASVAAPPDVVKPNARADAIPVDVAVSLTR
jgi:hypothetical protein